MDHSYMTDSIEKVDKKMLAQGMIPLSKLMSLNFPIAQFMVKMGVKNYEDFKQVLIQREKELKKIHKNVEKFEDYYNIEEYLMQVHIKASLEAIKLIITKFNEFKNDYEKFYNWLHQETENKIRHSLSHNIHPTDKLTKFTQDIISTTGEFHHWYINLIYLRCQIDISPNHTGPEIN